MSKSTNSVNPFDGDVVGCGNFIVYKLSENDQEFISIALHASSVELRSNQSYGVGKSEALEIKWKKFDGDVSPTLCNDVAGVRPTKTLERAAKSGVLNVRIDKISLEKSKTGAPYKVTLVLKNVVFDGLVVDYLEIQDAQVGWIPG